MLGEQQNYLLDFPTAANVPYSNFGAPLAAHTAPPIDPSDVGRRRLGPVPAVRRGARQRRAGDPRRRGGRHRSGLTRRPSRFPARRKNTRVRSEGCSASRSPAAAVWDAEQFLSIPLIRAGLWMVDRVALPFQDI